MTTKVTVFLGLAAMFVECIVCQFQQTNYGLPRQSNAIQSGVSSGGITLFAQPVSCNDQVFGSRGPIDYTVRNDLSCCNGASTRPFCCLQLCSVGFRTIGDPEVRNQCDFPGVANITTLGGRGVTCNAVFVVADVRGETKRTFLTTETCKERVDDLGQSL
ncbi:hypothetical protein PoB_004027800, partial [Plakobranchus ocellatus]